MSAPFISPAPWTVNASGGARTIVARDRSVVAVVMGCGSASPFEDGNAALMAASPAMRDALTGAAFMLDKCARYFLSGKRQPEPEEMARAITTIRKALAKSEQDGGAPEDGPVETGTGV